MCAFQIQLNGEVANQTNFVYTTTTIDVDTIDVDDLTCTNATITNLSSSTFNPSNVNTSSIVATGSLTVSGDITGNQNLTMVGKSILADVNIASGTATLQSSTIDALVSTSINTDTLTSLTSKFLTPAGVFISTKSLLFLPISPLPIGD